MGVFSWVYLLKIFNLTIDLLLSKISKCHTLCKENEMTNFCMSTFPIDNCIRINTKSASRYLLIIDGLPFVPCVFDRVFPFQFLVQGVNSLGHKTNQNSMLVTKKRGLWDIHPIPAVCLAGSRNDFQVESQSKVNSSSLFDRWHCLWHYLNKTSHVLHFSSNVQIWTIRFLSKKKLTLPRFNVFTYTPQDCARG